MTTTDDRVDAQVEALRCPACGTQTLGMLPRSYKGSDEQRASAAKTYADEHCWIPEEVDGCF